MSHKILYLGLDPSHYVAQGDVTHFPMIQIVPRPLSSVSPTLCNFKDFSHLIMTSKSSVDILINFLKELKIDLSLWKQKETLAVGKVTAERLLLNGITPMIIAQEETAEGVIHELRQLPLSKANILWPHSSKARPIIKDFLNEEKLKHTTCILYDPIPQKSEKLPCLEMFDEIVFTSPSIVEAFFLIFGTFPLHVRLTAIGPITSFALEQFKHKTKINL